MNFVSDSTAEILLGLELEEPGCDAVMVIDQETIQYLSLSQGEGPAMSAENYQCSQSVFLDPEQFPDLCV